MLLFSIKNKLRQHRGILFDILIIIIIGLLPLSWFSNNLLIDGNELNYSLSPNASNSVSAWLDSDAPGLESTRNFAESIFRGGIAVAGTIGISLVTTEKIYFVFLFMGSGLSMYFLIYTLTSTQKRRLAALIGALFWMFNPFVMNYSWHGLWFVDLQFFFPLLFALFIRGLRANNYWHTVFIGLVSIFFLSHTGINIAAMPPYIFIIFAYLIMYLFINRKDKAQLWYTLKFSSLCLLVTVLFNIWWILPQINSLASEISSSLHVTEEVGTSVLGTLELESRTATLPEVLRLGGMWSFFSGNRGDLFISYSPTYYTSLFQVISYLIPLLAFAALLKIKNNTNILFFAFLTLTGLFFMKGLNEPGGGVFAWLFNNVPLFSVFRHFQNRFGPILVLGYSFLIGITVSEIFYFLVQIFKPKVHVILRFLPASLCLTIITISLFGIYCYPMWTGEVIQNKGNFSPSMHVEVPDYYQQANQWLLEQTEDFKLFGLPYSKLFYSEFDWDNGYSGVDPSDWLFCKPSVKGYKNENYRLPQIVATILSSPYSVYETDQAGKLLALLNVKYVLVYRDSHFARMQADPWWISATEDSIRAALAKQQGLVLEKTFGKLDFYRNQYWQPTAVYTPDNISFSKGSIFESPEWASIKDDSQTSALFLSSDMQTAQQQILLKTADQTSTFRSSVSQEYTVVTDDSDLFTDGFESKKLGDWLTETTIGDNARVTNSDSYSGNYSAELSITGEASNAHMYHEFAYNNIKPIVLETQMKIVSRQPPGGAYIYVHGFDSVGVEKARVVYFTYDNWDTPTGPPSSSTVFGDYPYYVVKKDLGSPKLDKWFKVSLDAKADFQTEFPGVWNDLDITRIRIDLCCWSDNDLTVRYDDLLIQGLNPEHAETQVTHTLEIPQEGNYHLVSSISPSFEGVLTFNVDGAEKHQILVENDNQSTIESWRSIVLGDFPLEEGSHTIQFTFRRNDLFEEQGFETGDTGDWTKEVQSIESSANVSSDETHTGKYALRQSLSANDNEIHTYKYFTYDGTSPISFSAWVNVKERQSPSGAFIYFKGFNSDNEEKVRIIYYLYDNWDTPTGTPEEHGWGPYYALKIPIGYLPLDTWVNISKNPRTEFETQFPGVWNTFDLTRIQLDLYTWGDNSIISYYDDIKVSGFTEDVVYSVSTERVDLIDRVVPTISSVKYSPNLYKVQVDSAEPYFLILSQSYHTKWKAYYGDVNWFEALFKAPIAESAHYKVNGYANAWYLDKTGDYTLTIYFKSQSYFYIGLILSLASLLVCAAFYIIYRARKRR